MPNYKKALGVQFAEGNQHWKKRDNEKCQRGWSIDDVKLPPTRLSKEMFELTVEGEGAFPEGTPCLLRPYQTQVDIEETTSDEVCGNRILCVSLLLSSFSDFTWRHNCNSADCVPEFNFHQEVVRGLCVAEYICCKKCKFSHGPYKMYEDCISQQNDLGGRPAGKTNVQLQTVMTKLSLGYHQAELLFAGLDVPPPSISGMYKTANKVTEVCKKVNKNTMLDNQRKVAAVAKLRGQCAEHIPVISAESDVAYNNPPKGRSMSQPGTQAYAPLIENVTQKKMVIAFNTATKHCSRAIALRKHGVQVECPHHDGVCMATWPENTPLGNAETTLAKQNAEFLEHVAVKKLCTDNDSKLVSGTRQVFPGVEKMDCTVHASRGQRRRFYKHPFTDEFYKRYKATSKANVNQILSTCVTKRCTAELQQASKIAKTNDVLQKMVWKAKVNIVMCFSGRHDKCRQHSLVCKGTRSNIDFVVSSLPEQKWLNLSEKDIITLGGVLDYKLGPEMVLRQRDMLNTNKSEATHLRVFKSLPKSNTWLRNYEGRAHSAIHSATRGTAKSLIEINEAAGVSTNDKCRSVLNEIDRKTVYRVKYTKTTRAKASRMQNSRRKCRMKCAYSVGYKTGMMHPQVRKDHAYSNS